MKSHAALSKHESDDPAQLLKALQQRHTVCASARTTLLGAMTTLLPYFKNISGTFAVGFLSVAN